MQTCGLKLPVTQLLLYISCLYKSSQRLPCLSQ